jgi:5-aminopentanamidase
MNTRSEPVRVAVAQIHCVPCDVEANLAKIEALTRGAARDGAQLIIFPETATTGYFISEHLAELAEPEDGPTARRLAALARECSAHLAVGMVISAGGRFFDALLLFGPDGSRLATYRKAHLFSLERQWYAAGDEPVVVDTSIGRIGMTVCYDLIFPEYIRRLVDLGAEIVINSTNWITDSFQRDVWGWSAPTVQGLAATRALENGIWLAMANCVGPECQFDSIGYSCIVAPSGKVIASTGTSEGFASANIVYDSAELAKWKSLATYRLDRRPELYGG